MSHSGDQPNQLRLLIVEDVEEMRAFLSTILETSGRFHVVGQAANGWEARLSFERKRPAWVLLDELLPGESSLDLLRDFKALGAKIILMSGMGSDSPLRAIPAEAAGRVSKPEWDGSSRGGPETWLQSLFKLVDVDK